MENYQTFLIEDCVLEPQISRIYFENEYIGEIEFDETRQGYAVYPAFAHYSGFFKTREGATIELVFHYYAQTRAVPMC